MKMDLDAYQKSVMNLKHKIIYLEHITPDGSKRTFREAEVISVDLKGNGMSILDQNGVNHVLQGGIFRSKILRQAPFREKQSINPCQDDAKWPLAD